MKSLQQRLGVLDGSEFSYVRNVQDVAYPSAQPNNPLTGGGYYNTSAFQSTPNIEGFKAQVIDNRPVGSPAIPLGTLYVEQFTAANSGDAFYAPSASPAPGLPLFSYGVLTGVPASTLPYTNPSLVLGQSTGQNEVMLQQVGTVQALCTTGSIAIAPGTLLTADGNGNLTPFPAPSAAPTPTVTPTGTTGAVTVTYALVAISQNGTYSAIGTGTATSTSNATGSGVNFNLIQWTPTADAVGYIILRTTASGYTPATVGVIGQVGPGVHSFNDTGLAILPNTSATVAFQQLAAPSAPAVVQVTGAVAGTTSYAYKVSAVLANGVGSVESSASTTLTTGNAVLSTANGNKITWTAVTGAAYYIIDRSTGGATQGVIGTSNNPTVGFVDYGLPATAFVQQTIPNALPNGDGSSTLAVAKGTLAASTTTPTLVSVQVGGGF